MGSQILLLAFKFNGKWHWMTNHQRIAQTVLVQSCLSMHQHINTSTHRHQPYWRPGVRCWCQPTRESSLSSPNWSYFLWNHDEMIVKLLIPPSSIWICQYLISLADFYDLWTIIPNMMTQYSWMLRQLLEPCFCRDGTWQQAKFNHHHWFIIMMIKDMHLFVSSFDFFVGGGLGNTESFVMCFCCNNSDWNVTSQRERCDTNLLTPSTSSWVNWIPVLDVYVAVAGVCLRRLSEAGAGVDGSPGWVLFPPLLLERLSNWSRKTVM